MPFELTHLAVGLQSKNIKHSPSYLAGLIYPDIRYPARLERALTHELTAYEKCNDKEFVGGVKNHLLADKVWDELVIGKIPKFSKEMSEGFFIGVLKLIHDRVAYGYIADKFELGRWLKQAKKPNGLPVDVAQWEKWIEAINQYLIEGPTEKGWLEIITSMNFLPIEEVSSRIKLIDPAYDKYREQFEKIHKELVVRVGDNYA